MDDIITRLADLHDDEPTTASDAVVTDDVRRGRRALGRRRVRIGVAASAATLVAAGALTAGLTGNSTASHTSLDSRSIKLVDYTGTQPHGFDVAQVPDGWVLKDSTPNYLDIAEPSDNTDGSVFINKLVVMLESVDETGAPQGTPVTVNGHPGAISERGRHEDPALLRRHAPGRDPGLEQSALERRPTRRVRRRRDRDLCRGAGRG